MSDNYGQLLSLLRAKASDQGKTTGEIADLLGVGLNKALVLLREARAAGVLTTGKRQITTICGKRVGVPVYRLKAKGGKCAIK